MVRITAMITLCFLAPILQGQETVQKYDGPIYIKPQSGFIPVKYTPIEEFFDGLFGSYSVFDCSLFEFRSSTPKGWTQSKIQGSITFKRQYKENEWLIINIWKKKDAFLPDLEPKSMIGYAEGLKKKSPAQVEILNYESDFKPQGGIQSPFNEKCRMLSYLIKNPENQKVTRFNEYFVFTDTAFVQIVIKTPEEGIDSATKNIAYFINNLVIEKAY